jgi:hypothetical protein
MNDNIPVAPAPPTPADVRAWLDYQQTELVARRDELLPMLNAMLEAYPVIEAEPDQEIATDNAKLAKALVAAADTAHKAAKDPYWQAGKAVDAWFRKMLEPLLTPLNELERRMLDYMQAKVAKAKAAAPTARKVDLARTTGVYGAVASLVTTFTYEVEDLSKVPADYLTVDDRKVKAVMADRDPQTKRPRKTIPGIRWVEQPSMRVS